MRSAKGRDGGYAGAKEPVESVLDAAQDPPPLFLVWTEAGEVVVVRARVKASGVEEVHVRIHVAGNDPLPLRVDDDVVLRPAELRSASDGADAAVLDSHIGPSERRPSRAVEESSVEENDSGEKPVQTILRGRSGFRCIVRS